MSQTELAAETGLLPSAISHFETGRRTPSLHNLYALCVAMGCPADYLIGLPPRLTKKERAWQEYLDELDGVEWRRLARIMKCSKCGGNVEWKGPLSNLTHTECAKCGGINCQESEVQPEDDELVDGPTALLCNLMKHFDARTTTPNASSSPTGAAEGEQRKTR